MSADSVSSSKSVKMISVELKLCRVKSTFLPDNFRHRAELAENQENLLAESHKTRAISVFDLDETLNSITWRRPLTSCTDAEQDDVDLSTGAFPVEDLFFPFQEENSGLHHAKGHCACFHTLF